MKYILLLIFYSVTTYSQVSPTSGFVEYGIEFEDSSLDNLQKMKNKVDDKQTYNIVRNMVINHKKIYNQDLVFLELYFKNGEYILKPVDIMLPESLKGKFIFKSDILYGDINSNTYLKQYKKQGNTYIAPINADYEWKITNDKKNILGYVCRKAILEIEANSKRFNTKNTNIFTVWFTSQIPVAFSPVKYYGLPGAILEATTSFKRIYAKNIEFTHNIEVEKPTDGINLTAKEYKQMMSGFGSN